MTPRTIAVLAVAAAFLLAGCGGGAGDGPTTDDPTATDAPTGSPDPATTDAPTTDPGPTTTGTPTDAPTETPTDAPTETPTGTPGDPLLAGVETFVFDHSGVDGAAIEGGIVYSTNSSDRKRYVTVVAARNETDRFDAAVLGGSAEAFVADTAFEDSYLVAIQAFPASSVPDYRVEAVERTDAGLHLRVDDSGRYGTDDVTVETLLVRVPRDGAVPEVVSVTTEDGIEFDSSMGVVNVDELEGSG